MRLLPSRPVRIPQLFPRVMAPDDPAVFGFNAERDEIVREVVRRIVSRHADSRSELEVALNDVALHEIQRLELGRDGSGALSHYRALVRRIARMSDEEKRDELERIVRGMAKDVAGNFDTRVYRFARYAVPKLLTGVMSPSQLGKDLLDPRHSYVDDLLDVEGDTELLRRLGRRGTLVFVPTHSSNLDSIVLGYALERSGLPPVVYGAGKNLFSNPIISFFMHNLGAYRVDRRIRASLYKDVLKTYSCVMIERGYHSLFFPGGTRSRSGMIERRLKLGLAGTALEAYGRNLVAGHERPVWFVPTTINYSLVLEAESLVEDWLTEAGRARYIIEDDEFSQIDRWVAFFRKLVGLTSACIVRFGRPLDPFGNDVDDDGRSLSPQGMPVPTASYVLSDSVPKLDPARDAAYMRELAEVLIDRFERETVIMTPTVVAHALFRRLVAATPRHDLFARLRVRGEVALDRAELLADVGDLQSRLRDLEGRGRLRVSRFVRDEAPDRLVARALGIFRGYHARMLVQEVGSQVTIEDPTLLLYYQNRLVPFALDLAGADHELAAREITSLGSRA